MTYFHGVLHWRHIAPYRVTGPQSFLQQISKQTLADGDPGRDLRSDYPRAVCIWPWAHLLVGLECLEYPGTGRYYVISPSFPISHISLC